MTSEIVQRFARIAGWGYSASAPRIPEWVPGIPLAVRPPAEGEAPVTNCTTWTAWALLSLYPEAASIALYRDLQIFDRSRPWSPIEGVELAGIGRPVALDDAPQGAWLLSQSWTGLAARGVVSGSRGHARLVRRMPNGALRVAESSASARGSRDHIVPAREVPRWGETRWALLEDRWTC